MVALFVLATASCARHDAPPSTDDPDPAVAPERADPDAPAPAPAPAATADPSAPTSGADAAYGLVEVLEDPTPRVASVVANAGFVVVHEVKVDVEPGDVLRVSGQVEVTNDFVSPVNATLRARVDGASVGNVPTENAVVTASHHMPLWVDAAVPCVAAGERTVAIELAAGRDDASPALTVENGYGHVVVEHYRRFAGAAALATGGARGLAVVASDHAERASTFGGSFADRAEPYAVTPSVRGGDVVRAIGLATSLTPEGEMHGLGVFQGDAHLGPWSTKNGVAAAPDIPLAVDAVDRPSAGGARPYALAMYGVFGRGGTVVAGGGGLDVLVFRAFPDVAGGGGAAGAPLRVPAGFPTASAASIGIVANAPAREIAAVTLGTLDAGTPVRVAAHVTAIPAVGFPLGIACTLRAVVASGGKQAPAPLVTEYVTPDMGSVALALRSVVAAPAAGDATLHVTAACSREDASPAVTLSSAVVVAEPFVTPR